MGIDQIIENVRQLNASCPAEGKKKKIKSVAAAPKTNGHTVLSSDEHLLINAARFVAALDLEARGITADAIVASVRAFEQPYQGVVQ